MPKRNIQTYPLTLIPDEEVALFNVPEDVTERVLYQVIIQSHDPDEQRGVILRSATVNMETVINGSLILGGSPMDNEILHIPAGETFVVEATAGAANVEVLIGTVDR